MKLKFFDLFSGGGGFRVAIEQLGHECSLSCEINEPARETYIKNFPGEHPFPADVRSMKIPDGVECDALVAGFPCQAFSSAGMCKGFDDARGTLFFDLTRVISESNPKLLVLENVHNLIHHDNGKTIAVVLRILRRELGYTVFFKTLNSKDFGLPQSRRRIFFVCFRADLGIVHFDWPRVTTPVPNQVASILEAPFDEGKYIIEGDATIYPERICAYPKLEAILIGYFKKKKENSKIYSTNGPGVTVVAMNMAPAGSGGGLYWFNERMRRLSPRECFRMQGFPDSFQIPENDNDAYTQAGNAVPPPLARVVIEAAVKRLTTPTDDPPWAHTFAKSIK